MVVDHDCECVKNECQRVGGVFESIGLLWVRFFFFLIMCVYLIILSSLYLLMFSDDRVTRYTRVNDIAGDISDV